MFEEIENKSYRKMNGAKNIIIIMKKERKRRGMKDGENIEYRKSGTKIVKNGQKRSQ